MFHGLGRLACLHSELTSETMNLFRHYGRTPWTPGDWSISRPLPTQGNTKQKKDIHSCLELDSRSRF